MKKPLIYICDFDDSFTLNIYSDLVQQFKQTEIKIIPLKELEVFLQELSSENTAAIVILGPGPGHPDDYQQIFPFLKKLFTKKNLFWLGVCLGHQIIWRIKGAEMDHCHRPMHGQVSEYILSDDFRKQLHFPATIKVQRYNSLAITVDEKLRSIIKEEGGIKFEQDNELIIAHTPSFLSYQFHPESVGSECSQVFWEPLRKHLV